MKAWKHTGEAGAGEGGLRQAGLACDGPGWRQAAVSPWWRAVALVWGASGLAGWAQPIPPPPYITNQPASQTAWVGSSVTFNVGVASNPAPLSYQWRLNAANIGWGTNVALVLTNAQISQAGLYSVVVTNRGGSATSSNASLAVSLPPTLVSMPLGAAGTRSLTNTTTNIPPSEPAPCGLTTRTTRLLGLRAGDNGTCILDTVGSSVATVLAVYASRTTNWPSANPSLFWAAMTPVACDVDSASDGVHSRVQFTAHRGTNYAVQVGGVDEARGTLIVNWRLGTAPAILSPPTNQTATAGSTVTFNVMAAGTPSPAYQWRFHGADLPGATNATLTLSNVSPAQAGDYNVVVQNFIASVTSSNATLAVVLPIFLHPVAWDAQGFRLRLTVPTAGSFSIRASSDFVTWTNVASTNLPAGTTEFVDRTAGAFPRRFYNAIGF